MEKPQRASLEKLQTEQMRLATVVATGEERIGELKRILARCESQLRELTKDGDPAPDKKGEFDELNGRLVSFQASLHREEAELPLKEATLKEIGIKISRLKGEG